MVFYVYHVGVAYLTGTRTLCMSSADLPNLVCFSLRATALDRAKSPDKLSETRSLFGFQSKVPYFTNIVPSTMLLYLR